MESFVRIIYLELTTQLISDRDKQHSAITLALGGLYPAPEVVHAILSPQDGIQKKILDLGERYRLSG
jgi:hypothetical protein